MHTGPDPVGAVHSLVRLRLFSAVFTAPKSAAAVLGEDYGGPCAAVMSSVHDLMDAWKPQVRTAPAPPPTHPWVGRCSRHVTVVNATHTAYAGNSSTGISNVAH